MNIIPKEILKQLFENKQFRKETLGNDVLWFMSFYFTEYLEYPTAPFQKEILKLIQNLDYKFIEIIAFRGSAKSTYCSLILPIFSIVGKHQKKHILLVGQTQEKAEEALMNIRQLWEILALLMKDFGPIRTETDQWNRSTLVFGHYGAKIRAVSMERSLRGTRHMQHRPDLIICDDIEDVASSSNAEQRDKRWQFINSEVIPAGDLSTNFIFIGNLVHEDSVMMRLKKVIQSKKLRGICRQYPLVTDTGEILWPGKYPNMKAIEDLKQTIPSEIDYLREYMLKIVPAGDRIIIPEDIHRYTENDLLPREAQFCFYLVFVDPAVSLEKWADKTAIIVARVYNYKGKMTIYVSPHPINKRMTWPDIKKELNRLIASFDGADYKMYIEGGSSQNGLTQILREDGINAEAVMPQGNDKSTRLAMTRPLMQNKTILFPESGTEELEMQMLTFGTERFDDLVDALTLIPLKKRDLVSNLSPGAEIINTSRNVRGSIYNASGKDWADVEDEEMLRKTNTRGTWERISG